MPGERGEEKKQTAAGCVVLNEEEEEAQVGSYDRCDPRQSESHYLMLASAGQPHEREGEDLSNLRTELMCSSSQQFQFNFTERNSLIVQSGGARRPL